MRTGYGFSLVLSGVFAACTGEIVTDAGSSGFAGRGFGTAGVAGVAAAGSAGNGGSGNAGATAGTSGSTSAGGNAAASGAGGTSGAGGSSGAAGNAGVAGASGAAGSAGSVNGEGGAAGDTEVAGASGTTGGASGGGNEGGTAGAAGEGGAPNEGGSAGEGRGSAGEGGGENDAGAAGQNTAGAGGASGAPNEPVGLSWPIDCVPNETCTGIGYPDTDADGDAYDCGEPGYFGHQGTDIGITFEAQTAGTAVRAAADGVVLFAFDGKYDQCPNANEPDCQEPSNMPPGSTNGTTVCTPEGPYCGTGQGSCYWCFAGGNVIVIRHTGVPGVFATRYDHLKRNSVLVEPGDTVTRGQKIAEAASAGASTAPHLHFEVWGTGFYELADPWAGTCGPNTGPSLWASNPPWSG